MKVQLPGSLNLAQAFNPIGSLLGMFTAMAFIQAKLSPLSTAERAQLSAEEFEVVKAADLQVLIGSLRRSRINCTSIIPDHPLYKNAQKCRPGPFFTLRACLEKNILHSPLPGRCDCTILLCWCTNHVLDFHYPIWYTYFCEPT